MKNKVVDSPNKVADWKMLPSCEVNIIRKTANGCYLLKWMSIIIITRLEHQLSLLEETRRFTRHVCGGHVSNQK